MRNSNVKHLTNIAMGVALNIVGALVAYRSEERRVGKEC